MSSQSLSPLSLSALIHAGLAALILSFIFLRPRLPQQIQVAVNVTAPQAIQQLQKIEEQPQVVLKSINKKQITAAKNARQVFGVNRQSLTAPEGSDGIEAKLGNTLAKAVDQTVLTAADADALPVPTEEYLVSQMPRVLNEVRPTYPAEARAKGLEGAVAMSILIDDKGAVREVEVLSGPEIFRAVALAAMQQFRFQPALAQGAPVAVRIAYTIRFTLDY